MCSILQKLFHAVDSVQIYISKITCAYIYITHNIVHAIIKNRLSLHQKKKKIIINRECRIKFVRLNPYK